MRFCHLFLFGFSLADRGILAPHNVDLEVAECGLEVSNRLVVVEVSPRAERTVIEYSAAEEIALGTLVENEVSVSLALAETEFEVDGSAIVDAHSDEVGAFGD